MPIDYKKYPPNWKKEIVPAVLKRANNCCEQCGVPNKSLQWRGRKIVEIVAISGRKRKGWKTSHYDSKEAAIADGCEWNDFDCIIEEHREAYQKAHNFDVYQTKIVLTVSHLDHDETNWDVKLDRLKAMCQLCHLRYDSHEKYLRTAMGSHLRK